MKKKKFKIKFFLIGLIMIIFFIFVLVKFIEYEKEINNLKIENEKIEIEKKNLKNNNYILEEEKEILEDEKEQKEFKENQEKERLMNLYETTSFNDIEIKINKYEYTTYKNKERDRGIKNFKLMIEETLERGHIEDIKKVLEKKDNSSSNSYNFKNEDFIKFIVENIQEFSYKNDIEIGVNDYYKYPIETLFDKKGDCEDTSLLLSAILESQNIENVLILYEDHMAVGVKCEVNKINEEIKKEKRELEEEFKEIKGKKEKELDNLNKEEEEINNLIEEIEEDYKNYKDYEKIVEDSLNLYKECENNLFCLNEEEYYKDYENKFNNLKNMGEDYNNKVEEKNKRVREMEEDYKKYNNSLEEINEELNKLQNEINEKNLVGEYFEYRGSKYCYIETTDKWEIGEVPENNKYKEFEIIEI